MMALGGVPCTNLAIVLVTKHFYLIVKQWRSEAEHGRWPQQASLIGGNSGPHPRVLKPPAVSLLLQEFLRGTQWCVDTGKHGAGASLF